MSRSTLLPLALGGIDLALCIEKQRAPEMNRAHADRLGAPPEAFKLARGEAEIELPVARF